LRAVIEYVPEMRSAIPAHDFLPDHAVAIIDIGLYGVTRQWQPEAWPAGSRIVFVFRAE
jgi:hypothetical protein